MPIEMLEKWRPYVRSILRIVVALLFLQHGLEKLFGFPAAGPPLTGLIILAALIETFGGLLLLVGLWSREAAFIMSGEIAVAYFMRRAPNGFFPQVNGGGFEVLVCFVFLFLFFAGPGPWSVDATRRPTAKI